MIRTAGNVRDLPIEDDSGTAESVKVMLTTKGLSVSMAGLGEDGNLAKIYDYGGDGNPPGRARLDGQIATAVVIESVAGGEKRITQYVPARALSLLRHPAFRRRSQGNETALITAA